MTNYEFAENKIMDRLNDSFHYEFDDMYRSLKIQGKSCILKYIPSLFRKWYYSALIEDTVITPASVTEYGSNCKNIYPVVRTSSISRIGNFDFIKLKYSLENHPICIDFRGLVERFRGGVALNERMQMEFEDARSINNVINCDPDYITYLIMLGIDMEYIEKMPSVGVEMYCTTDKIKELDNINNRELLSRLFECAVKISSSYLSDAFLDESYNITAGMIKKWLIEGGPVDKIFEEAYGEFSIDVSMAMAFEDMDKMEMALTANTYLRGLLLDKWFLTPFSGYFRFIDTTYMYEFSYYDEIMYLINAEKTYEILGEEEIIDAALYAPCTLYKTSCLGAEFFNIEYNDRKPFVFEKMDIENIMKGVIGRDNEERRKILEVYEPEFNVYDLKVSFGENEKICYNVQVKENMPLNEFHTFIAGLLREHVMLCKSYRFYKIPESPFTEYTPSFMGLRGPHTEDYTVGAILGDGEICYYELVIPGGENLVTYRVSIELENVTVNEAGTQYPRVLKSLNNKKSV